MNTTVHPTNKLKSLLTVLRQNRGKPMSYNELSAKGFDLSDSSLYPIGHLIDIKGSNKDNYSYTITSNGIGYLEDQERKEQERQLELDYRFQTIAVANEANRISEAANKQSKIANQIARSAIGESKKANTLSEDANRNSKFSNKLSIIALALSAFSALGTVGSLIVSIIALCN